MQVNLTTSISYTLILNADEAQWLKNVVQNPIGVEYEDELEEHRKIRQAFWDALDNLPKPS